MSNPVFDKTGKGREEIATRKYHLAPRLRTLLVLVDGKQNKEDLLKKVAGIGLGAESIDELFHQGFIEIASGATPEESAATRPLSASGLPEGGNQLQAIRHFYTETIKSTVGLRGYGLQLKVEKAASIDDFRALRQLYLDAVLKAKGNDVARSLSGQLDRLLYLGESGPPDSVTDI